MRLPRVRYTVGMMMVLVAVIAVVSALLMALRSPSPWVNIVNDTGHPLYDVRVSCDESREDWAFGRVDPGEEIRCPTHADPGAFAILTYSSKPGGRRVKYTFRVGGPARIHLIDPESLRHHRPAESLSVEQPNPGRIQLVAGLDRGR